MEDLDAKIDVMGREKIFSLIAENSVRFKKINVRHTGNNNKNSIEHLNELLASYEKLLRAIPREFLKIEQTIRLKFRVSLDEQRKIKILSLINQEMELIIGQMSKKFQELYKLKGSEEEFISRMEKNRIQCNEIAEKQMEKVVQNLKIQLETSEALSPSQLEKKYGIDQNSLNQLHLVKILQEINSTFETLKNNGTDAATLSAVHEGIVDRVKIGKMLEKMLPPAHQVVARKEWRMRVAKESVRLKEMINSIHALAGHFQNPKDQRNFDVIKKTWDRMEHTFEEVPEEHAENVLSRIKPFYDLLECQN